MSINQFNAGLQRDDNDVTPGSAGNPLYTPWQTLSALANETGQAVKHTFTDSGVGTGGHVQQSAVHHTSPDVQADAAQSAVPALNNVTGPVDANEVPSTSGRVDPEAVQAEIGRVESKMISMDAAKEVVLRFNFLSGLESRVRAIIANGFEQAVMHHEYEI